MKPRHKPPRTRVRRARKELKKNVVKRPVFEKLFFDHLGLHQKTFFNYLGLRPKTFFVHLGLRPKTFFDHLYSDTVFDTI